MDKHTRLSFFEIINLETAKRMFKNTGIECKLNLKWIPILFPLILLFIPDKHTCGVGDGEQTKFFFTYFESGITTYLIELAQDGIFPDPRSFFCLFFEISRSQDLISNKSNPKPDSRQKWDGCRNF